MPKPKPGGYHHKAEAARAKRLNSRAGEAIDDVLNGRVEGRAAIARLGQAQGALLEQRDALDSLERFARQQAEVDNEKAAPRHNEEPLPDPPLPGTNQKPPSRV